MFEQTFKNIDDVLRKEAGCTNELDYTEQTSWLLFLKYLDALEQDKADEAGLDRKKYTFLLDKPYRWDEWAAPKGKDGQIDHNRAKTGDDLRDFVSGKLFPYSKIRPYLMKVARPDFKGLCSADMYPLAPLPNEITRDYLFHLLLSKRFTDYAIQGSARAGMPKVNREHLFEVKVWLPEVKKQKHPAATLDELHEETHRLARLYERKLAALEALKKSLLRQAFAGELSAPSEQFLQEAVA